MVTAIQNSSPNTKTENDKCRNKQTISSGEGKTFFSFTVQKYKPRGS